MVQAFSEGILRFDGGEEVSGNELRSLMNELRRRKVSLCVVGERETDLVESVLSIRSRLSPDDRL